MIWQKFLSYLNIFGKRKTEGTNNISLKLMHGMNRISILVFLVALIMMIVRRLL